MHMITNCSNTNHTEVQNHLKNLLKNKEMVLKNRKAAAYNGARTVAYKKVQVLQK